MSPLFRASLDRPRRTNGVPVLRVRPVNLRPFRRPGPGERPRGPHSWSRRRGRGARHTHRLSESSHQTIRVRGAAPCQDELDHQPSSGQPSGCSRRTASAGPPGAAEARAGLEDARGVSVALIICLSMLAGEDPLGAVVGIQERERRASASTSLVTVQTSWDLSGVPSVGIGNLAMKDRSR